MSVVASVKSAIPPLVRPAAAQSAAPVGTSAEVSGRSLIPIMPPQRDPSFIARSRPSAAFLAQLIAIAQQAPQTRQRRRAEPGDASAAYASAAADPIIAKPTIRRSM
jgi:hypothetical protein